jgi:hypothetical protein
MIRSKYEWYLDNPYKYLEVGTSVRWFGTRKGENVMLPYNCHFAAVIIDRRKSLAGFGWIYTLQLDCDQSIIDEIFWTQMVPRGFESPQIQAKGLISVLEPGHGGPHFNKDVERLEL